MTYLKRLNSIFVNYFRCIGGFLQFVNGEELDYRPNEMSLCGANKRYSPPVVLFRDFVQPEHIIETEESEDNIFSKTTDTDINLGSALSAFNKKNVALLLFRVEETTSQSQFLAHYSFTPIGENPEGTALHIRGGKVSQRNSTLTSSSEEDYTYSEGICHCIYIYIYILYTAF